MRSLATSRYTHAEVAAQLKADSAKYTARFDVLNSNNNKVGDIDGYVVEAFIEFDADREIKGSLDLTLLPVSNLADDLFNYRIKPWFGVVMPDGGTAEYAQGVYMWALPNRELVGLGSGGDTWTMTLPDLGWALDMSGPGINDFKIERGQKITGGIRRALQAAKFDVLRGIVPSEEVSLENLFWSRRRNVWTYKGAGGKRRIDSNIESETWRTIIEDLTDLLGYDELWFDHNGNPVAAPSVDVTRVRPDVVFESGPDGILLTPLTVEHQWENIANRVFARNKARNHEHMNVGRADANNIIPNHPFSQRKIGHYIDVEIDLRGNIGLPALNAAARRQLFRRMSSVEIVEATTLAWPVSQAYDIIGLRLDDDHTFATQRNFHETRWTLQMVSTGEGIGTMVRRLRRIMGTGEV